MIHERYIAWRKAFINGKLYNPGDVISHFPGLEHRKSFRGIGDPIEVKDNEQEIGDEIKRAGAGKWRLPNGDVVPGKLIDAQKAWDLIKQQQ